MLNKLMNLVREEEGQGMAEYGLILALVAIAAVTAFTDLGGKISTEIGKVVTKMTTT